MTAEPTSERGAAFGAVIRAIDAAHEARGLLSAATRPEKSPLRDLAWALVGPLWLGLAADRPAWAGPAPPTPESLRRAADGLEELAAELRTATEHVDDAALESLASDSPSWGKALRDDDVSAPDIQPRVTEAIEILNRHKVRLILGRDPFASVGGDG